MKNSVHSFSWNRLFNTYGMRPIRGIPINQPAELGLRCPVCKNDFIRDGEYDERLSWSEFNFHIWCTKCKRDYPTCFCVSDLDESIQCLSAYLFPCKK